MLEYGQPMHAFDYRYVSSGKIVVRESVEGETITTLDGNLRTLKPGMLVIADGDKPIGLAGIMGGENSEIVADTATVVFESANFNGTSIRQTALALGLRTEASGKFEKNLDPMLTIPAVQRACELVEQLACGDVLDGMIDIIHYVPSPSSWSWSRMRSTAFWVPKSRRRIWWIFSAAWKFLWRAAPSPSPPGGLT